MVRAIIVSYTNLKNSKNLTDNHIPHYIILIICQQILCSYYEDLIFLSSVLY